MKNFYLSVGAVLALTGGAYAQQTTLQGIPVDGELAKSVTQLMTAKPMAESTDFTFDDITFWVGEGENRAALVLQWNDDREEGALVWGYRFDGTATGFDMIKEIAAADDRLYFAASQSSLGYTIGGIGYDLDGDGDIALLENGNRIEVVDGMAENSNYDNLTAADSDDLWISGWYSGYWSYWVSDDETIPPTGYSSFGASSRQLTDGSVDGWIYSDFSSETNWKTLIAVQAPITVPELPEKFTDGFFIQNEDWFGHTMGSINWVDNDGNFYYNVDNKANGNTEVLGTTSQYGIIYGNYYYAMSKQAPRLVIMDAQTLQVVKSFDTLGGSEVSGDGRAVLGVSADKVYVGTDEGIFVLDVANDFTLGETPIEGTGWDETTYSSQIGMMARVGKYVFAAKKSVGILVIDPETDTVVKTIDNGNVCGLTVDRNGTVWAVAQSEIVSINPATLESKTQALPNKMVSPWGTWMADKMCADPDEDALYYAYGNGSWANSETQIGKLTINEDGTLTENADFTFTMPEAATEGRKQILYGKIDIDPQSGYLLATTTQDGYGANYSYNWLHYINSETGEVEKTVTLTSDTGENYYWFPSMPVFPDNHEPEITLDEITLTDDEQTTLKATNCITDDDNLPALAVVEVSSSDENVFTVTGDGVNFTVAAVAAGEADLEIAVNSNGRIVEKSIPVIVEKTVSINDNLLTGVSVYPTMVSNTLNISGVTDGEVTVFGLTGTKVAATTVTTGNTAIDLSHVASGAYIVKVISGNKSYSTKIIKL